MRNRERRSGRGIAWPKITAFWRGRGGGVRPGGPQESCRYLAQLYYYFWSKPVPAMQSFFSLKNLLWLDGLAALAAGVTVGLLRATLAPLFHLPESLLATQAIVSLGYAGFSLSLARQKTPPQWLLLVLVLANLGYAGCVLLLLLFFYTAATGLGVGYFLLEAGFVVTLAALEWQQVRRAQRQGG